MLLTILRKYSRIWCRSWTILQTWLTKEKTKSPQHLDLLLLGTDGFGCFIFWGYSLRLSMGFKHNLPVPSPHFLQRSFSSGAYPRSHMQWLKRDLLNHLARWTACKSSKGDTQRSILPRQEKDITHSMAPAQPGAVPPFQDRPCHDMFVNGTSSAIVTPIGIEIATSILGWSRKQESLQLIFTKNYLGGSIRTQSFSLSFRRANVSNC